MESEQSTTEPIEAAAAGRDAGGRFTAGNKASKGNKNAKRVAELRSALMAAVRSKDVKQILEALIEAAKKGDTVAAREVLDRTLGKPSQSDVMERLEKLEQLLEERRLNR